MVVQGESTLGCVLQSQFVLLVILFISERERKNIDTHSLLSLHCPYDLESCTSGDNAYKKRTDDVSGVRVRPSPCAGDVSLDGPKHEQDDTGDGNGEHEHDVCPCDEKVGMSPDEVSHPDDRLRWGFFYISFVVRYILGEGEKKNRTPCHVQT